MEPFNQIVLVFIVLPVAILNIILFYKVWVMTNDTMRIRRFLEAQRPDLVWNNDLGKLSGYEEKKEEKQK